MMEYIDSWKSKSVFEKQLELNKKELAGSYPPHWNSFLKMMGLFEKETNLLDIGCGVGSYSELCRRHLHNIRYTGVDYSDDAISIAKENWPFSNFIRKNVNEIDHDFISKYDIVHMGALLDVLPNAEEVLDRILKFSVDYVILSRVDISDEEICYTYQAYDEITTYKFIHSESNISETIRKNNYQILNIESNNLLLKKINL